MIQAIVVDDEHLVRERLKVCIDWNALGYEIAGEAGDGEEALELLEHLPVQLAIVDINMPIVDGLEFARTAQEKYPHLKMIILTGYSSFEYARKAMQAGVSDYLLKPIDMEELQLVLRKLRERILAESEDRQQRADLQMNRQQSDSVLRRSYIQSLLDGSVREPDRDKLQAYMPRLRDGAMFAAVFSLDGTDDAIWRRFAVANIVGEVFAEDGIHSMELTYDEAERVVGLLNIRSRDTADMEMGFLLKTCQDALRAISRHLKFTVTAGIGSVVSGVADVRESYREAVRAVRYKTIAGGNRIIRGDSLPPAQTAAATADLSGIREEMLIHLRLGNAETVEAELRKRLGAIAEGRESLEKLELTLYELVATLNIYAAENRVKPGASADGEQPFAVNPSQVVDELETVQAIGDWLCHLYRDVLLQVSSLKQSTPAKLVEKAKAIIDEHYADADLDLSAIAGRLYINPSYLSRIFKQESGYSVVEYVTKRRMDQARTLMEQGCKNLYFIAESVGYNDSHYFSKCFKKQFGLPPSKFIQAD